MKEGFDESNYESFEEFRKEQYLIGAIFKLPIGATRDDLIDKLEKMPNRSMSFSDLWIRIHYRDPMYVCWSDEKGYDPNAHFAPEEIQWLFAAFYVRSDVCKGGFFQCMVNPTGGMLPEVKKWCDDAGCKAFGTVVGKLLDSFGSEFPRSAKKRFEKFSDLPTTSAEKNKFLDELDAELFASVDELDSTADKWLKKRFGITRLKDNITT